MGRAVHRVVHRASPGTSEWAVPRVAGRFSDSETSWVLAGGAEGSFLCSLITDFLAEGAGWGASPGRGGELGCQAQQVLKKMCEIGVGFSFAAHSESFESQGARAAKRYVKGNLVEREKGDEFGIKLLLPHRLSPVGSKK